MKIDALESLLASPSPHLLVNVLPADVCDAVRIPGTVNACVYEMTFLESIEKLAASKQTPITLYGAGAGSCDAEVACEKLMEAGYETVAVYEDGLAGWRAADKPLEGGGVLPRAPELDGRYGLDTGESVIRWTGRNLFNHHSGSLKLKSGEIRIRAGVLESAAFTIDMESIACEDIEDAQANAMLIRHLKDRDFFEVGEYPVAEFVSNHAEFLSGASEGMPNYLLKGHFTIRGTTRELEFPVLVASADGERVTGQAQFELDRTEFGSIYGSGKFFKYLGQHIVNDLVHLHVKIHADRGS